MTLRIAYMTGEYPRATDTFIQREVAALRERGVGIETLSIRKPPESESVGPEQRAERERTFYVLPPCPWELFKAHVALLATAPQRYLGALRTAIVVRPAGMKALVWQAAYFLEAGLVARRLRSRRITHLHNHFSNSSCSVAMLAAQLGGFTYSFTMHGPAEFYEPNYWRVREKIARARFVCCISQFARSQAMVFSSQSDWPKLHVVHCGVKPALFARREHQGPGHRLLFVGRLAGVKGVPALLDALARLAQRRPDVELTLAGDGPERRALEAETTRLGISRNVKFVGYQSQSQVRELLAAADVFVMASFAEGVPVVLMEAMAAGVPVVATQIAGVPELVENGISGFLVPPGDPEPLAARIETLLADASLRERFAAAGRAKVEREFDVEVEAGKLHRVLTDAVRSGESFHAMVPGGGTRTAHDAR